MPLISHVNYQRFLCVAGRGPVDFINKIQLHRKSQTCQLIIIILFYECVTNVFLITHCSCKTRCPQAYYLQLHICDQILIQEVSHILLSVGQVQLSFFSYFTFALSCQLGMAALVFHLQVFLSSASSKLMGQGVGYEE